MDFHTLPRRDLQFLCKKNKIPANITNVAMADALEALQIVEGIDEVLNDALKLESPKKAEAGSPELPRTASRRASARRAPEPKGTQGSPLPRSRRVTAKASEIMQLVDGDGVEEEEKQEGKKEMPKTPAAALRSSRKPQGTAAKKGESGAEEIVGGTPAAAAAASGARTARRRTSKKEEQEGVAVEVPLPTPAPRGGRRTAARNAAAAEEDEKEEEAAAAGASRTTARRTRQTARKATESAAASTAGRRVTRAMAAAKMAELDQEEEEEEDNDLAKEGIDDPKNGSPQASDEQSDSLKNMEVLDSKGTLVEKMDGCEGVLNECNEEVGEQKRDPLSGLEDSPIRGLVSEVDSLSLCDEIVEKMQDTSITDLVPVDSHPTEERNGGDGPDGKEEGGSGEALSGAPNDELILLDSSKQMGGNNQDGEEEEKGESRDGEVLNLPLQDSAESETIRMEDTEGLLEISSISEEVLPKTAAELSVPMDDAGSAADPTGSPAKEEGIPEDLINSSAKSSPPVGDPTGEIIDSVVASLTNTSIDTGDLVENTSDSGLIFEAPETQPLDSSDCSSVETTTGIMSPVEAVEEKSAGKGRVSVAIYEEETSATETKVADSLTMVGAESGEAEAQFKAEDQNLPPKAVDLHSLSLRKLQTMYKEKLINVNNNTKVMEGKRLALAELNENLLL